MALKTKEVKMRVCDCCGAVLYCGYFSYRHQELVFDICESCDRKVEEVVDFLEKLFEDESGCVRYSAKWIDDAN